MAKSSNGKTLGFVVLIVGAAYFYFRPKSIPKDKPSAPPQSAVIETKAEITVADTLPLPTTPEQLREERKRYSAMISSGLSEIPSKKTASGLLIKLKLKAWEADCSLGDFDLLKGVVNNLLDDSFLLAIEPIHRNTGSIVKRFSLKDLDKGLIYDIPISLFDSNVDYGISLCFDFKKSQECKSKPMLLAREWKSLLNTAKQNDRVFYYQMMSVSQGRAYHIPSVKWDEGTIQKLKSNLRAIVEQENSLDTMGTKLQKLSPIPAKVQTFGLEIALPARNSKCL